MNHVFALALLCLGGWEEVVPYGNIPAAASAGSPGFQDVGTDGSYGGGGRSIFDNSYNGVEAGNLYQGSYGNSRTNDAAGFQVRTYSPCYESFCRRTSRRSGKKSGFFGPKKPRSPKLIILSQTFQFSTEWNSQWPETIFSTKNTGSQPDLKLLLIERKFNPQN